ncbi:DUF3043 domain-containing protein [Ornithinimicrobium sufpigmenti]|uniref:DUF3043 domain-containing protein n=1 Tax=Ornithinimicrobium sufpigmenti TaxID=2508882 RepID=UPI001EDD9EF8|nr:MULTISPECIES: DUF3043 domain-containing protein [unclassified Ornithinimicrobium]
MLFGKKTATSEVDDTAAAEYAARDRVTSADASRPQGKGRPTPRRREAEAANRRPLVVDKKTMSAEQKAKVREERAKARESMLRGEERYLPPRDRGPERRFLRDAVDSRWNIGEVLLPIMLFLLVMTFLPIEWARMSAFLAVYGLILFGIVDCWLLWRRTKKRFVQEFGHEPGRGSAWYLVMRSFQMRGSRVPRAAVERGSELGRR